MSVRGPVLSEYDVPGATLLYRELERNILLHLQRLYDAEIDIPGKGLKAEQIEK